VEKNLTYLKIQRLFYFTKGQHASQAKKSQLEVQYLYAYDQVIVERKIEWNMNKNYWKEYTSLMTTCKGLAPN